MDFKPLSGKVLVRLVAPPTEVGGILLPQNAVHSQHSMHLEEAQVVAVGEGVELVAVGNNVLLRSREGNPVKVDGQKYFLFDEDKIMAIV